MEIGQYPEKAHIQQQPQQHRNNNKTKSPHIKKMVNASKREGLLPKQSSICTANMSCRRLSSDKNRMVRSANIPFNPDPLNLSALCNRKDGTNSPVVLSPSLDRSHQFEPDIHEPIDTRDPLNLDGADDKSLKGVCKRKKRKRRNTGGMLTETEELLILSHNIEKSSDCEPPNAKKIDSNKLDRKFDNSSSIKPRGKRERSKSIEKVSNKNIVIVKNPQFNTNNSKYRYGNFIDSASNVSHKNMVDTRLNYFTQSWFEGKKCLDVGCNTGRVTTLIAKHFSPAEIVGVDIDPNLIKIGKKKARESAMTAKTSSRYPISFCQTYGPILQKVIPGEKRPAFPNNLSFVVENFVPTSSEQLELIKPIYDCILCLNVTKWVQLNNGDTGLKWLFKKMYALLQPGGRLILESQSYSSYKKKKNMAYDMWNNLTSMKLMPADFVTYLLSNNVGFSRSETLTQTGYDLPIYLLTK